MHCIVFESSREQSERHEGLDGHDLWGGPELRSLNTDDVIWVITRLAHERPVPAICGRLIVTQTLVHSPDHPHFQELRSDCRYRVITDAVRSVRCPPFRCEVIDSWPIWRSPFQTVVFPSASQCATLEDAWAQHFG
ncbi:MAG: hypothetical protein U0573_08360 [Phycisphaerales bacterium]